jgi:hypothetical protein
MKHIGAGGILALLLCLSLVSPEVRGDNLQQFLAQLKSEAASKPMAARSPKPSTGEKAYCRASCGGGTTIEVDCPGVSSCMAVDQNCPYQQGYVQCGGGSRVYCQSACPQSCTAQCKNGTTVSVNCAEGCTQMDQDCGSGEGYAQCNGGARVNCPPPPPEACICHAYVACPDGENFVECEGHNDSCQSYPGGCSVWCDGVYKSCPICW